MGFPGILGNLLQVAPNRDSGFLNVKGNFIQGWFRVQVLELEKQKGWVQFSLCHLHAVWP